MFRSDKLGFHFLTGVITRKNVMTRKIKATRGKTDQEARLKAEGLSTRPVFTIRSSSGAPISIIPESPRKQDEMMKAMAEAILSVDALPI